MNQSNFLMSKYFLVKLINVRINEIIFEFVLQGNFWVDKKISLLE